MTISYSDIILVLSGGLSNTNPDNSLGGNASLYQVGNTINNLFSDVSSSQSSDGYVDYRCIYVQNMSATDTFYNVQAAILSQVTGGSDVQIGVLQRNEVQGLSIQGSPTGGTISINYEGYNTANITYSTNPATFAANVQSALNAVGGLSGVVCLQGSTSHQFTISFTGKDGGRNQNLLTINTNSLTPASPNPIFTKITSGGPRNDVASAIASPTVVPNGVAFTTNNITIGNLRPEEGFPIWVQRTTAAGTLEMSDDGFSLQIVGDPFP